MDEAPVRQYDLSEAEIDLCLSVLSWSYGEHSLRKTHGIVRDVHRLENQLAEIRAGVMETLPVQFSSYSFAVIQDFLGAEETRTNSQFKETAAMLAAKLKGD